MHRSCPTVHLFYPVAVQSNARQSHPEDSTPNARKVALRRSFAQLVWVLIALLLLLYLGASYLFWAKTESAWPIFR